MSTVAAVDLGATTGRVMLGQVGSNQLSLREVARFDNVPVSRSTGLHWNTLSLYARVLDGLRAAAAADPEVASVGIDSWAVDYALLRAGAVTDEPFHYRDPRTALGVERVHAKVAFAELFARNGLQFLPFTTLYQLACDRDVIDASTSLLLIPDLMTFHLTGQHVAEVTNASTTGLLNVTTRAWDVELMRRLDVPATLFAPLAEPGTVAGTVLAPVTAITGLAATPVITVGSHDTASAVVGTPMVELGAAFISCGTWALVGVETERPVLTAAAREANFTNEAGVDGRNRFLHNVMGLWLLSECIRGWRAGGEAVDLAALLASAADFSGAIATIDVDDPAFLAPGDMPARIADWCAAHDQPVPTSHAQCVRSIIESLASAFARAVDDAARLSGTDVRRIHLVGGGALNELLCARTAQHAGVPVLAGPVEATAIGNVLVQGRALGATRGTLESLRSLVAAAYSPRTHSPHAVRR